MVTALYSLPSPAKLASVNHECAQCDGLGLSPTAGLWADKWYGLAPFSPEETGSAPYSPGDLTIYEVVRKIIEESGQLHWWLNKSGAEDLNEAIYGEAVRLCEMWNSAWRFHLDRYDIAALYSIGISGGGVGGSDWFIINDVGLAGLAEHKWHGGTALMICLLARAERMGFELHCGHCDNGLAVGHLLPG